MAFPVNAFPNILAANVPHSIGKSPTLHSFVSFSIFSLIPFISNPDSDSSSDLTIFIVSSVSSFETINAVVPDPITFFE